MTVEHPNHCPPRYDERGERFVRRRHDKQSIFLQTNQGLSNRKAARKRSVK